MPKIEHFEDLICWQKARELTRAVYAISDEKGLARDFELRNQLRRAALSVMTNIAEGFARYHKREFVRFLDIAQSSAAEVRSLLYIASDLGYTSEAEANALQILSDDCRHLTLGLLRHVTRSVESKSSSIHEEVLRYDPRPIGMALTDLPEAFFLRMASTEATSSDLHSNT